MVGNSVRGEFSRWEFSRGEMSWWEMSRWEMTVAVIKGRENYNISEVSAFTRLNIARKL